MTTPRPTTILAALATSALLLTGCSEETPEPKFAETPTAEPTPVEQEETAEEFIRRWARAQNEMLNKGDTSEYRDVAGFCDSCVATADRIDNIYKAGGFVKTAGMTVRSIALEAATKRAETYTVVADLAPTEFRESAQATEQSMPGGRSTYSVVLGKSGQDGWIFANYMKVPD